MRGLRKDTRVDFSNERPFYRGCCMWIEANAEMGWDARSDV